MADQPIRQQVRGVGPTVRAAERAQRVDPGITPHPLHVVAGHDTAEGMADDVYPLVAGLLTGQLDQALHALSELLHLFNRIERLHAGHDRREPLRGQPERVSPFLSA